MKNVDLKKASTFYLVGNLFNKGIAFLTVPIFTRILSTSDYGIVTTYNSWISILSIVMGFAIYMGIRAAFIDYKNNIDDFMSVCTTFTLACGGFMCLFLGAGAVMLRINVNLAIVILCLIHGMASALIQNYSMYLMMQYRYRFRTALMILPNLLAVIISIIAILLIVKTDLYMGKIVPTAMIYIAFGLFTVLLVYRKSHLIFHKEYLKFALSISAPLVLHGIALNVLSQSDRTMLTWLADASQTGIYSLIYNFSMIAVVITTAFEGIWVPWFTGKMQNRNVNSINIRAQDYIHLMTYTMVCVIMLGPEVVKILASEKYWEGTIIIPPIVLANYVLFAYTLYVNIEHYYKKTIYITINTIFAAVLNLVLNYFLIPRFGYVAAAYTTLVSYLMAFVLHARYAKKMEPDLYPISFFIRPFLNIIVMVIIFYLFLDRCAVRLVVTFFYMFLTGYRERSHIAELFPTMAGKFKKKLGKGDL